jgi:hypothetical protein
MDPRLPPLSSSARALFAKERALPAEDAALKQRVIERARAALEDRPSGILLKPADSAAITSRASRAPRTILLVAAAVAVAGLAAAGAGFYTAEKAPLPGVAQVVVAPHRPAVAPAPARPAPESAPPVSETPPAHPTSAAPAVEAPKSASASSYALELGLLEPARQSIARGDFGAALGAIAQHQREYPRGQLTEEREALRVRALWGMGKQGQAESAAGAFRKRYPRSGLLSWMKSAATPP